MKSTFFESEQVQEDLHTIFQTYQDIASQSSCLPKMEAEEKKEHIAECKALIDRQKIFYHRLALASQEDPEAADMKNRINMLVNAFGYKSLPDCMDAMIVTLDKAYTREFGEG